MTDDRTLITAAEIAAMPGLAKTHFLNDRARRTNKSLGDACGLSGLGVHLVEIAPGDASTEHHVHHVEEEAVFVLSGTATVVIGEARHPIGPGDFMGHRAGGAPHSIENTGEETLVCLVVGQRLAHDVADYPRLGKRLVRTAGLPWDLVDMEAVTHPQAGAKR